MDSPNQLFIVYLQQLREQASERGNIIGCKKYKKCIGSLLKYPLPLQSPDEAEILEGFGDKICADLNKMLQQHAAELNLPVKSVIEFSRPKPIPDEWWQISRHFRHQSGKVAAAKRPKEPSNEAVVVAKSARLDDGVVLVVDQREVCGRGQSKSQMRRRLEKFDTFTVNFITLNISDFCFLWRNQVRLLIERKRIDDLAASIKDKRYAEQKKRLKECATTRSIYLIEHKAYHGTIPLRSINQAIANVFWHHHFHVIFTKSVADTVVALETIGSSLECREQRQEDGLTLDELNQTSDRRSRVTKKTHLARMLECIHGMRPEYAEKLSRQFGTFNTMKRNISQLNQSGSGGLPNSLIKSVKLFFDNI